MNTIAKKEERQQKQHWVIASENVVWQLKGLSWQTNMRGLPRAVYEVRRCWK